ncbi:MAG: hypothetical protein MMC33_003989 [Icmadophila ericetorum]|nr:hypothetical protein [Icmadophila ericetorum]
MDRLPPEILHEICFLLETENDIPSFRLLARRYALIGFEYLMPVIHVSEFPESLKRLKAIADHPIRNFVDTLVFRSLRGSEQSETHFIDHWEQLINTHGAQELLYNPDVPVNTLRSSLRFFPRLRCIKVTYEGHRTRRVVVQESVFEHRKYWGTQLLPKFLSEILPPDAKIEELWICDVGWPFTLPMIVKDFLAYKLEAEASETKMQAFRDLRILQVNLRGKNYDGYSPTRLEYNNTVVRTGLASASRLEELDILFDHSEEQFSEIFRSQKLDCLRSLSLRELPLSHANQLTNVLCLYADTLTKLHLDSCDIYTYGLGPKESDHFIKWNGIFCYILESLNLRDASITGLFSVKTQYGNRLHLMDRESSERLGCRELSESADPLGIILSRLITKPQWAETKDFITSAEIEFRKNEIEKVMEQYEIRTR